MSLYTTCDIMTALGFSSSSKLEGEKADEICGLHHTWKDNKCVPDTEAMKGVCGPLSTWDAATSKCVADTKDVCGTHASFDDEKKMCVLQQSVCGEGTTLLDGVCVLVSSGGGDDMSGGDDDTSGGGGGGGDGGDVDDMD